MISTPPSETFEATTVFASGLAGTLGVRIRDNQGADTLARTTTGITADTTVGANSVYRKTFTAPAAQGQFTLVWDDGTNILTEELVVSATAATAAAGPVYATRAELKQALSASGTTYLDDDLDDALNAASRAIDNATGRQFYPTTDTRVYTADYPASGAWVIGPSPILRVLEIDDVNTVTTLMVDNDGDGVYETTWTAGTDFYLDPPNNPLNIPPYPYERVVIPRHSARTFPTWNNSIQIVGSFGFSQTPHEVKQYTKIFAAQLLLRSRQAPFGILMAGVEIGAMTRLSRFDPDFDRLLGHLVKPSQLIA